MILVFIEISEFDLFSQQKKNQVLNASTSYSVDQFPKINLSCKIYYYIESDKASAIQTPLKDYEWFTAAQAKAIRDSEIYLPIKNSVLEDSEGRQIIRPSNVPVDEHLRVRHKGVFNGDIPPASVMDIDYVIEQLSYNGVNKKSYMIGIKYCKGCSDGDELDLCLIDRDGVGVTYGWYSQQYFDDNNPVLLDKFGDKYFADSSGETIREHQADLVPGAVIRLHYKNNSSTDTAKFRGNLIRYMDTK